MWYIEHVASRGQLSIETCGGFKATIKDFGKLPYILEGSISDGYSTFDCNWTLEGIANGNTRSFDIIFFR